MSGKCIIPVGLLYFKGRIVGGLFGYFQYAPFCANEDSTAKQADPYDRWYEFQIDYFDYTLFGGMKLPCITLEGQQVFHIGYKACEVDKHFEVHYIIHKGNAGEYHSYLGWINLTDILCKSLFHCLDSMWKSMRKDLLHM